MSVEQVNERAGWSMPPLFVADHVAIDFLNSTATPGGETIEWIGDGSAYVHWLVAARLLEAQLGEKFLQDSSSREMLDQTAKAARDVRDWFRAYVEKYSALAEIPVMEQEQDLELLNRVLATGTGVLQLSRYLIGEGGVATLDGALGVKMFPRWTSAGQLLQPVALAMAEFISKEDVRLVKHCEGHACSLMFLDRTKAGRRRWCAMGVCGNRAKAAAFRSRGKT